MTLYALNGDIVKIRRKLFSVTLAT